MTSVRARSRRTKPPSRAVFRPVLSSPFTLEWPPNAFADTTTCRQWLQGLSKPDDGHQTIGINACARAIEKIIAQLATDSARQENAIAPIENAASTVLLVCRHDVDPPSLLGHVPMLVAVLNALQAQAGQPPWPLCVLPQGMEPHLAKLLSVKQCSIATVQCPREQVPTGAQPTPSWLAAGMRAQPGFSMSGTGQAVGPSGPQVKMIRSTAPLDANAMKAKKKQVRQERRRRLQSARKSTSSLGKREAAGQKKEKAKTSSTQIKGA